MAGSVARAITRLGPHACTFFAQRALLARTENVHVFHAGDWPIPTDLHNSLFFGALPELARFLQRPVRAMH